MLTQLSVKNHTLVEQLEIDCHPALTAITGETGAGKSILLNALGLTLGDRADFDQVRSGSECAEVHACFNISELKHAQNFLNAQDMNEGNECILRRTISSKGVSKAWINGRPINLKALRQLAQMLISIHSQHEHQSLVRADYQQQLLDNYAQAQPLLEKVNSTFLLWKQNRERLQAIESDLTNSIQQQDFLNFQLEELQTLGLELGEIEQLEAEQKRLSNAGSILENLQEASNLLQANDNHNVISSLQKVSRLLAQLPLTEPEFVDAKKIISDCDIQIQEAQDSLQQILSQVDLSPERLIEVNERLSNSYTLARKHQCEPDHLPTLAVEMQVELEKISHLDAGIESLKLQCSKLEADYKKVALQLSKQRQKAAKQLCLDVQLHLNDLNMQGAAIQIELNAIGASTRGTEQCEFQVITNPGQSFKPLGRIASGGELSRISLAIQLVTAANNQSPTLVFDEVDVGIGGSTAQVMGKKLRELGKQAQVICVTHLAQVAAHAHQQMAVTKSSTSGTTQTDIQPLTDSDRKQEIARMLSGDVESEQSLQHAETVLAHAQV